MITNIKCVNNKVNAWNGPWTIPFLTEEKRYEFVEYDKGRDEVLVVDDSEKLTWFEGFRFIS